MSHTTAPLVAGMEEAVATEVVASLKAALGGEDRPYMELIERFQNEPRMVSVVTNTACFALLSVAAKHRKRIDALEARAGGAATKGIGAVVPAADAGPLADVYERLTAIESRVTALENQPQLKYLGVYDASQTYAPGSAVTRGGSVWIAMRATRQRPDEDGDGARDWRLAVKHGANGRDLR